MKGCSIKIFTLILLCLSYASLKAQTSPSEARKANEKVKFAASDVLGKWYSSDTINSYIEFVADGDYSIHIEGYRPGVGQYTFVREKDSICANGTAPNWPPYDCTLHLIDSNTLEIMFYQYYYETTNNQIFNRAIE